jgi:N-acetylmuramoyl-L-alanine amidase
MVTSKKSESETLANTVHGSLMSSLLQRDPSARDRGVKRAPFYVLLGAKMPAILVECAFISNGRDRDRLSSNNHLDLIADGIVDGAAKYLRSLGDKS